MVLQKSPHNTTTTFSLPGTDYDVSYNQSLSLVTPTSGNLPACASLSGGIVTVNSAPCEITGFSFPTSIVLYVSSGLGTSNQVKIDNNKFQVLSTNVAAIRLNGGACNVLIENNEFTDNATAGGSGVVSEDIFNECASGTVSVEYNYCHDVWQKCEDQNSNTGGTLTFNWEYNLNVDISLGLTDNGHGETTYAFASVGNTHHQIDIVTDEFNVYYSPWDTSVQSTTNASQTALDAALQADGIELENSITAHNLILAPGPYSVTGSNNSGANGITGSANEFPGVQDSGSISGTMTSTDNYMYYPGVYFPYNTTTVTGYTFSDINAGTGNSCNPTTCN